MGAEMVEMSKRAKEMRKRTVKGVAGRSMAGVCPLFQSCIQMLLEKENGEVVSAQVPVGRLAVLAVSRGGGGGNSSSSWELL